jgi:hypothetical protein
MVVYAQDSHRVGQFTNAVLTKAVCVVSCEMLKLGNEDLPFLAERAGNERDLGAIGRVLGHGRSGTDGFIVGMGVHKEHPSIAVCHAGHGVRLLADTLT